MKTYYEILEVDKNASMDIIKKVFKYKIKQNHPDLFSGDEKVKADNITKELNQAYDVLSDDEKRKEYDLILSQENEINTQSMVEENNTLREEIEFLKSSILKKDFIIDSLLNHEQVEEIYEMIDEGEKIQENTNKINNSNNADVPETPTSLLKSFLLKIFYFIKDSFLPPIILIAILFGMCLILKYTTTL